MEHRPQLRPLNPVALAVVISITVIGFVLAVALAIGGSYAITTYKIDQNNRETMAAAKVSTQHLCSTLDALASIPPPAGNPATNPSRLFQQRAHDEYVALAKDLNC